MSTPLQRAREAKGLTQTQLAERVDVRQSTISRLEAQNSEMAASPELAARLASELNISELEILYPERYPEVPARKSRGAESKRAA